MGVTVENFKSNPDFSFVPHFSSNIPLVFTCLSLPLTLLLACAFSPEPKQVSAPSLPPLSSVFLFFYPFSAAPISSFRVFVLFLFNPNCKCLENLFYLFYPKFLVPLFFDLNAERTIL